MDCRGTSPQQPERLARLCWGRFHMEVEVFPNGIVGFADKMRGFFPFGKLRVRMTIVGGSACVALAVMAVRHGEPRPPGPIVVIIESSPNNLDSRQGTDAQSERVGPLIFDALVKKDTHYNMAPWLATSWEQPDPLTWVFHLRDGVRFQNGQPLEAADVVWTVQSLIDPRLATLISAKSGNFAAVDHAEARDRLTVVVHMKRPDAGLPFNLSDGLFGVVPRGAGSDFGLHPVGSGPYRFVSQVQDKEVVLERSPGCWSEYLSVDGQPPHTQIQRLQFNG